MIETASGARHFDLKQQRWLNLPGKYNIASASPEGRWWLAYDAQRNAVVIDSATETEVAQLGQFSGVEFLNEESLLSLTPRSGWTIQQIAAKDGAIEQSWTPFWWVMPVLAGSVVAFFIWSYFWLRQPTQSVGQVWFTIFALALIVLPAISLRMKLVGNPFDLGRAPNQYGQGVIFALMMLSTLWLINSKQRAVIRLSPLLVTLAILSATVGYTFADDFNFVAIGVINITFPILLFAFVSVIFLRFKFRLVPSLNGGAAQNGSSGDDPKHDSTDNYSRITIQDMFLLVGVCALVTCLLYTSPSPRDQRGSRMPSSA